MNDCRRISRRIVLTGTALGLGAAAAVLHAAAQQKLSQADAKYQSTPKDSQHCDVCVNFQAPNEMCIRDRCYFTACGSTKL